MQSRWPVPTLPAKPANNVCPKPKPQRPSAARLESSGIAPGDPGTAAGA